MIFVLNNYFCMSNRLVCYNMSELAQEYMRCNILNLDFPSKMFWHEKLLLKQLPKYISFLK